ncbi:MAG: (Fe-S)-binding protein [Dehalococcoidia bacterium]|nr:(Fe-S)-binding protein [Dehalococcoidia bacterium]
MIQDYASQIHRCFRCGYCKFPTDYSSLNCPSYRRFRFDSYSTGGRLWLTYAWLKNEIEWSEHLANILYACTTCKNCVEQCPMKFSTDIVDWIVGARSDMVEKGRIPPQVARFFEAVHGYGNPLKLLRSDRAAWADGTKKYEPGDEYLFYVGCLGSYDENGQRMAKSLAGVLSAAGVSFGILGNEEECCGNEVYMLGEMGLFQTLAEKNNQQFKELSVRNIVTLSPHAYNVMKNNYHQFGADFTEYHYTVYHYTQLLYGLIKENKIRLANNKAKVTYQDPCFLGRYNQIYDEPRQILQSIPGIELVEMERNRENSFCCGGGSGNFIMDLLAGGKDSPSRVRVREAHDTGAEVLAVACPSCLTMFTDAIKAEDLDDKLVVKDISQIVKESLAPR